MKRPRVLQPSAALLRVNDAHRRLTACHAPPPRALIAVLLAVLVGACTSETETAGDFPAFWRQFSDAVARDSAPAVASLTRFPFLFENREHTEAEFGPVYAALFDEAARDCLTTIVPVEEDGQYVASCGPVIFVFARTDEAWRFTEFTADPEAALEEWRITHAAPAPWAAGGAIVNGHLQGAGVTFASHDVVAPEPLGCGAASYEYVITQAAGLFQGGLGESADSVARALGVQRLPTLTLRVTCDGGIFDYHFISADALLTALDNVVWTMAAEATAVEPAAVVRSLLVEHMTRDMGFTTATMPHRQRFLTPSLNAHITAYFDSDFPADEPPPINGDPFTCSQEYPTRFTLGETVVEADTASVRVAFSDGFRTRPVEFLLQRAPRGWRVADVRCDDGSALGELLRTT